MPTRYTTISIPEARGQQLREIAREHRKSVSDLLVGWIQSELTDLGWQDASAAVRGEFGHDGEELVIRADLFGGAYQVTWTIDQARSLASTIYSLATIGGTTSKVDHAKCNPRSGRDRSPGADDRPAEGIRHHIANQQFQTLGQPRSRARVRVDADGLGAVRRRASLTAQTGRASTKALVKIKQASWQIGQI